MKTEAKPKLFIGSSTEALPIASAIFSHMEECSLPTKWDHDIFLPGSFTLETLESEVGNFYFAILVGTPDDVLIKRGHDSPTLRDNVLFELGLFMGKLGRKRAFLVTPQGTTVALPSDLDGLGRAEYDDHRLRTETKPNYVAATETACRKIRKAISLEWEIIQTLKQKRLERLTRSEQSSAAANLSGLTFRIGHSLSSIQHEVMSWSRAWWPSWSKEHLEPWYRHDYERWIEHGARALDDAIRRATQAANSEIERIYSEHIDDARKARVEDQFTAVVKTTKSAIQDFPGHYLIEEWIHHARWRSREFYEREMRETLHERPWLWAAVDIHTFLGELQRATSDWWNKNWPKVDLRLRELGKSLSKAQEGLLAELLDEN